MSIETLTKLGCTNVKEFKGLTFEFEKSGFKFKLMHHTNDYGKNVDYWTIGKTKFTDLEDLQYYIKCL